MKHVDVVRVPSESGAEEMLQVSDRKAGNLRSSEARGTGNGGDVLVTPRGTVEIQLVEMDAIGIQIIDMELVVGFGGKSHEKGGEASTSNNDLFLHTST
jgi:hypothetical protein